MIDWLIMLLLCKYFDPLKISENIYLSFLNKIVVIRKDKHSSTNFLAPSSPPVCFRRSFISLSWTFFSSLVVFFISVHHIYNSKTNFLKFSALYHDKLIFFADHTLYKTFNPSWATVELDGSRLVCTTRMIDLKLLVTTGIDLFT